MEKSPHGAESRLASMLCFDLYAASQAFGRLYKPLLDPLNLTYPQYLVMVALWDQSPQHVGEIGQRLGLESNTLTPLLKRLETVGFVTRTRDTRDERRMVIALTEEGRALEAKATDIPDCIFAACGLSGDDYDDLRRKLQHVRSEIHRGLPARGA